MANPTMSAVGRKRHTARHSIALAVVLTSLLSACGSVDKLLDRRQSATNQELSVDRSTLSIYLADVSTLLGSDPVTAERAWKELQLDHERAPTTTNQLRLALAMATPGHAYTNMAQADALLTALLQKPQLLLSDEQLLANVHLGLMRARVSAESNARQANDSASKSSARELASTRAQLTLVSKDNERLRAALEEAEQKLQAITLIERSIREREDDASSSGSQSGNGVSRE
ncbi:MAG: hypothetical protein AB8F65_03765 [Woeseiaceae bacterium]